MYGFIFGAAGTGKTSYIYKTLTREAERHPEKTYYLCVPEQNTLKAQQELIKHSSRHGMLNLDVLSFHLLAFRVMEELGIGKPDILDEMSKSMLLRAACRKQADKLQVYGSKIDRAGFISQLKSAFSEFYQYDVTPDRLSALSGKVKSRLLSGKLSDLSLLYRAFQEALSDKAAVSEEIPLLLLRYIDRSKLLSDAVIVFDGYTGFTPVQYRIVERMMTAASDCRFALTIPASENPYRRRFGDEAMADLFYLSRTTVAEISAIAERNGIMRAEDISMETCYVSPKLSLCAVHDPEAEIRLLINRIRMLRGETRYRDMAVAVSDLPVYREALRRAFEEASIPYFMDDKADGRESVLAELVRAALSVIRDGYSYESVIRYLRNPLLLQEDAPAEETGKSAPPEQKAVFRIREMTDELDNYIRACGVRGRKTYEAEWKRSYRYAEGLDLPRLNAFKEKQLGPLFALHDRISRTGNAVPVCERVDALCGFLDTIHAGERLLSFCKALSKAGFHREAAENERFLTLTLTLFLRLSSLLPEEQLSLPEFIGIIEAGFAELNAGMIPEVMDRVIIGDLKRSRFEDISVLFMLGMNDGLIPSAVSGGGVLTDVEREELIGSECIELAPADRLDSAIQRFYLYLIMRKPRKRLYLSYCKNDAAGRPLKASEVLRDLHAAVKEQGGELCAEEGVLQLFTEEEALSYLAEAFSGGCYEDRTVCTVWNLLRRKKEYRAAAEELLAASFFRHEPELLGTETAEAVYGEKLYGSVTRFEQYEKCPYAHFLQYGLGLHERQQYEIEASDLGTLYHKAIDLVFREIGAEKKDLAALSEEELDLLSDRCVQLAAEDYNNQILQSSARNRYLGERVRRITRRTLWALRTQFAKGDFRLYGCEMPFRMESDGMSLYGRIDRVDVYEEATKVYVKVIDYKSGKLKFDLSLIWQGLQIQLITYMNAALSHAASVCPGKQPVPAGMFYYHIDDPVTEYRAGASEEEISGELLSQLRMNGLASGETETLLHMDRTLSGEGTEESSVIPVKLKNGVVQERGSQTAPEALMRGLSDYAEKRMKLTAEKILEGDINIYPYRYGKDTGCDYCPYHSVCGFDRRLPGYRFRTLRAVSGEEIAAALTEHTGKEGSADEMDERTAGGY